MKKTKVKITDVGVQKQLEEARRIFVDFNEHIIEIQLRCYCLMQSIFLDEVLPDNSATISGLLLECEKLDYKYSQILYFRHPAIKTYKEIASEISLSAARVQQIENKAIQLLRKRSRSFFLPKHQEFVTKYNLFLEAIQSGETSSEDIPVEELGLETFISNVLKRRGIFTASQMFFKTEEQLLKLRDFGPLAVEEIMQAKINLLTGNI